MVCCCRGPPWLWWLLTNPHIEPGELGHGRVRALMLRPSGGRIATMMALDEPAEVLGERIRAWRAATTVTDTFGGPPAPIGLSDLYRSLGTYDQHKQQHRAVPAGYPESGLWTAVLQGRPTHRYGQRTVAAIRADHHPAPGRVAIVQACAV